MGRKTAPRKMSPPNPFILVDELVATPRNFAFGLLAGFVVPVAAIAGVVAGIFLLTKKVPFITEVGEEDEERLLIVKLVEPEKARSLFETGKEAIQTFGDEIRVELEGQE